MSDRDPCAGCRHLVASGAPGRPTCARNTYYGEPRCIPDRSPAAKPAPANHQPRPRGNWR
jgi:hypothetical protein